METKPIKQTKETKPVFTVAAESAKLTINTDPITTKREEANNESSNITYCADLENKFLLVRVGDVVSPATKEEINDVRDKLENMFEENNINCLTFVTHHAVSIDIIEKKGI